MDWGGVIDFGEAAMGGGEGDELPKELEHVLGGTSCIYSM
jgi:hypothetical protein